MSYLFRLNIQWVKCATKLRRNYSSSVTSLNILNPTFISDSRRRFSTNLKPQLKIIDRKKPKIIKNESTMAPKKAAPPQVTGIAPAQIQETQVKKSQSTKLKKQHKEHLAKVKYEELEKAGRDDSLNKNLVSYLEVCVFTGDFHRAIKTLIYYRAKKGNRNLDIAAYNILLHGFAASGNLSKVKEVFQLVVEDKLPPSPQTYAAIFECLGRRLDKPNCVKNIRRTMESFNSCGFKLNDLFNHCIYERDQREVILEAIWKLEPSFRPEITAPFNGYVCPLLENLNHVSNASNYVSPIQGLVSRSDLHQRTSQQIQQEFLGRVTITTIEKKDPNDNLRHYRKVLRDAEQKWIPVIKESLERSLNSLECKAQTTNSPWSFTLYPYLKLLKIEDYVKIIMLEIRKLAEGSETCSPLVYQLYKELGTEVMSCYEILHKQQAGILDKVERLYEKYIDWYEDPKSGSTVNSRQKWQELVYDPNSTGPHIDIPKKVWHRAVLSGVGRFLYNIIMQDIKIDANVMKTGSNVEQLVPAFYSIYRMNRGVLKEEVKPHPALVKLFQMASRDELIFSTQLTPMVSPPLPWASIRTGGYIVSAAKIVRLPFQARQQMERLEVCQPENLHPCLDSLNQLGSVPWKINKDILDLVIEIFNNKGNELIEIPPPPSECPAPPPIDSQMTKEEVGAIYKQRIRYRRKKAEMGSLWCDALYKLSLANHFRDETFWLPHNLDFRGRVYPCSPHLTHLGSDVSRSMLIFARGEPLGPSGLDWLKIHLINLTGLKKRCPVHERLQYANEIMDDILDSAENPLTGRKWWMDSEEPWQTLSTCMEISKALKSGDPESFISHLPIHQDGSCNGLQHYAALGRDQAGAVSVNLFPCNTPQDVYSDVAALVEKQRVIDADNGLEAAKILEGFIQRKVIKQTVMTTVYGVTRYGARLQIAKQLRDITDFPQNQVWPASLYLSNRTFDSLQTMFTSTKEIQDWFTECARLISHVCGQNVEWITPLGLPIVQPYVKLKKTCDLSTTLKHPDVSDLFERPNVLKQKNAFPPNFVHSLDSSHMMLTSVNCERAGITFVSVHDCFWTHPKSVHIMNKICREQFVALHSFPILEDLSKFLVDKYSYSKNDILDDGTTTDQAKLKLNKTLTDVPRTGSFDLKNVLNSVYFFS